MAFVALAYDGVGFCGFVGGAIEGAGVALLEVSWLMWFAIELMIVCVRWTSGSDGSSVESFVICDTIVMRASSWAFRTTRRPAGTNGSDAGFRLVVGRGLPAARGSLVGFVLVYVGDMGGGTSRGAGCGAGCGE